MIKTENWDEGLPLGNGNTGSLVYGSNPLKITVDRTPKAEYAKEQKNKCSSLRGPLR